MKTYYIRFSCDGKIGTLPITASSESNARMIALKLLPKRSILF